MQAAALQMMEAVPPATQTMAASAGGPSQTSEDFGLAFQNEMNAVDNQMQDSSQPTTQQSNTKSDQQAGPKPDEPATKPQAHKDLRAKDQGAGNETTPVPSQAPSATQRAKVDGTSSTEEIAERKKAQPNCGEGEDVVSNSTSAEEAADWKLSTGIKDGISTGAEVEGKASVVTAGAKIDAEAETASQVTPAANIVDPAAGSGVSAASDAAKSALPSAAKGRLTTHSANLPTLKSKNTKTAATASTQADLSAQGVAASTGMSAVSGAATGPSANGTNKAEQADPLAANVASISVSSAASSASSLAELRGTASAVENADQAGTGFSAQGVSDSAAKNAEASVTADATGAGSLSQMGVLSHAVSGHQNAADSINQAGLASVGTQVASAPGLNNIAGVHGTEISRSGAADAGIATVNTQGHQFIASSPTRLEVGMLDGTHGWVQIRAELGAGGDVKAMLTASAASHEALRDVVPGMTGYLQSEAVNISAIAVHRATSLPSAMGQGLDSGTSSNSGQDGQRGQPDRSSALFANQDGATGGDARDRSTSMLDSVSSAGSQSNVGMPAGFGWGGGFGMSQFASAGMRGMNGSGSGSWVNVTV